MHIANEHTNATIHCRKVVETSEWRKPDSLVEKSDRHLRTMDFSTKEVILLKRYWRHFISENRVRRWRFEPTASFLQ